MVRQTHSTQVFSDCCLGQVIVVILALFNIENRIRNMNLWNDKCVQRYKISLTKEKSKGRIKLSKYVDALIYFYPNGM